MTKDKQTKDYLVLITEFFGTEININNGIIFLSG